MNILIVLTLFIGFGFNLYHFLNGMDDTAPWNLLAASGFAFVIVTSMWPMVKKSLRERLGLKVYGTLLLKQDVALWAGLLLFAVTVFLWKLDASTP